MQSSPSTFKLAIGGVLILGAYSMLSNGVGTSGIPDLGSQDGNLNTSVVSPEELMADYGIGESQRSDREPVPSSEALISIIEDGSGAQVSRVFRSAYSTYLPTGQDDMDAQYVNVKASMRLIDESGRWEFKATLKHTSDGWALYALIE